MKKFNLLHLIKTNAIPFLVILFLLGGLIVRNSAMSETLFYDWDEGIYAQVAWEIIQNKSLATTYNDQVWLNKPPFSHALIATMFLIFGKSEFWARMVMVGFGVALAVLTYLLTKKTITQRFPDQIKRQPPWLNQIVFLLPAFVVASASLYADRSILLNTDIILAVSWVGYFLTRERPVPKFCFLALGLLNKSILGFYPLLLELLSWKKEDLNRKNITQMVIIVVLASSWHIYAFMRYGWFFVQAHLFDQIVKRALVPIELHMGDKFFYFELLWDNLFIITLLILVGYVFLAKDFFLTINKNWQEYIDTGEKRVRVIVHLGILAVCAGVFLLFRDQAVRNVVMAVAAVVLLDSFLFFQGNDILKRFFSLDSAKRWSYIVLLSGLPFFLFLTVSKSKAFWYATFLLPLLALVIPYLYMKIPNKYVRGGLILVVAGFSLYRFVSYTYLFDAEPNYSDRLKLAECIAKAPDDSLAFLVDEQERKNRQVIEAAQYQRATSFVYGGSPSFAFYADKDRMKYFYRVDEFTEEFMDYASIAMSAEDFRKHPQIQKTRENYYEICRTDMWVGLEKFRDLVN